MAAAFAGGRRLSLPPACLPGLARPAALHSGLAEDRRSWTVQRNGKPEVVECGPERLPELMDRHLSKHQDDRLLEVRAGEIAPAVAPGLPRAIPPDRLLALLRAKTPWIQGEKRIGAERFELSTSWSQTRRATNCATLRRRAT